MRQEAAVARVKVGIRGYAVPTYEEEKKENLAAYERLKDEILSKYKGQYVAIAGGRLMKISPSFEEASESVRGQRHALVFPAGEEPITGPLRVRVHRVGSLFE